ncbi:MAG: FG-GAP repeat protein [Nannocystis sp.]|uniref:integrin alpha n=1 Tax=Nannocystis sp. TaxID=1962667 RepID=UPI00242151FF|nr:integrin alpha [Nannocystis sp.]MBK9754588.1 FG-GAP repeat protein [Nannocystis sp.]
MTVPGAVFVVLGRALLAGGTIEKYIIDNQAYRIIGPTSGANLGTSVAGIGDFNNDDLADLAIGQPGWMSKGRVYVIYSEKLPGEIQLADMMASGEGLVVSGEKLPQLNLQLGLSVGGAGDFNKDGFSDLLVGGAPTLKQAMVVFGGTLATEIDASTLVMTKRGQAITTLDLDGLGTGLGGGLDVNGDTIDDVVFGAPLTMSGRSYVVFGSMADPVPRTVTQLALGMGGYAIAGAGMNSESGASVALVPSVNGDGLADVFVGAPSFDFTNNEGRAYIVYGGMCEG